MKFTCNSCGAQYMISDEKVGPSGVKVRCKKCGNVVLVRRAAEEPAAAAEAPKGTNGAAPAEGAPGASGGLDAELGQAFDNAFGEPPPAKEPERDLGATQAMGAEDQAKVAAAAPAATEWYVAIGQAQVGPLPLAEVKRKWEAGDVGPDSLVWRPGMGDWQPLSSVAELAGYLAPVARAAQAPARDAATPRATPATGTRAAPEPEQQPAAPAEEVSWKPVGASALAALASEEIAARGAPAEQKPAASGPAAPSGVKSLVEGLPDGGGVDPTGAVPLTIKGLETTGEKKLERRSTIATRAEEARHKRSMTRVVVVAAVVVVATVAGAAAWVLMQKKPAPVVAVAPPPPPPAPAPVAPPPAAQPAPAPAAQPAPTPVAAAPQPEPPVAKAEPPPAKAEPPVAKPAPHPARPEPEPPARHVTRGKHGKLAKAEPPPRPAPTARPAAPAPSGSRKKDSLLDFDSSDSALDEALGGGGGGSKRSVYVPPAPGGGGLPDRLSPAQINEAVAGRIDSLRRCVSEQKARDPAASGVLKLKWLISADGSVRDVKSLPGEYASGPFSTCITGVVKGIRFPRSTTTGQEVTFPFSF